MRLKETCSNISNDRARLSEENIHLKAVLRQNGIAYGGTEGSRSSASLGYSPSASNSGNSLLRGSYSPFTPPLTSQSPAPSMTPSLHVPPRTKSNPSTAASPDAQHIKTMPTARADTGHGIDYEQEGIDFVLTYENSLPSPPLPPKKALPPHPSEAVGDGMHRSRLPAAHWLQ